MACPTANRPIQPANCPCAKKIDRPNSVSTRTLKRMPNLSHPPVILSPPPILSFFIPFAFSFLFVSVVCPLLWLILTLFVSPVTLQCTLCICFSPHSYCETVHWR